MSDSNFVLVGALRLSTEVQDGAVRGIVTSIQSTPAGYKLILSNNIGGSVLFVSRRKIVKVIGGSSNQSAV